MSGPLLQVRDLYKCYRGPRGTRVDAVAGVSFDIAAGETLGLVGESGCGKSSVGRSLMMLPPPDTGSVRLEDVELTGLRSDALRRMRPRFQMVFQDPVSSLNPRRSIGEAVAAPLALHGQQLDRRAREARVDAMLESCGLEPAAVRQRLPHELSGGQCQRVSIARALVLEPRLLVCDEPVSSLDVSVQAQILNLLQDCRERFGLTMLFIAHDMAVVRHVSDRVAVMYLGRLCEILPSAGLVTQAMHPYTRLLLASVPRRGGHPARADAGAHVGADVSFPLPATSASADAGDVASPLSSVAGCRFRDRCPLASGRCVTEVPALREVAPGHQVACHHV